MRRSSGTDAATLPWDGSFWLLCFLNGGGSSTWAKSSGKSTPFFLRGSRCVPTPWDFSSGSSYIFLQISVWERS